jgi:hypothetical protein
MWPCPLCLAPLPGRSAMLRTLAKKKDATMSHSTSLVMAEKAWGKVRALVARQVVMARTAHAPGVGLGLGLGVGGEHMRFRLIDVLLARMQVICCMWHSCCYSCDAVEP